MNQEVKRTTEEIIKILDHLRRETEETQGYNQKGDQTSALRNANASRDEVQDLLRSYQQLIQQLNR